MIPKKLAQRLATAGAVFALAAIGLPQVASGAIDQKVANSKDPAVLKATVKISDAGFDPAELTLPQGGDLGYGQITFTNTGTKTHSATQLKGTPNYGQAVLQNTPDGSTISNTFDTGGIAPGESVTLGFSYDGDYSYSSYPDCIASDAAPSKFDCGAATVHVVDYQGKTGALAHSLDGETLTDPTRRIPHRDGSGSVDKPHSGAFTIHISGLGGTNPPGYFPSRLYVTPGTTVTWVNDDKDVHQVRQRSRVSNPNDTTPLASNGLGTGDTYSYTFNYNNDFLCNTSGPSQCGGIVATSFTYQSGGFRSDKGKKTSTLDTILPDASGFGSLQSTMIGKIYVVVKCASVDADQKCVA